MRVQVTGTDDAVSYTDRALGPFPVDAVAGRRCVVTGGLGFIGANLALALSEGGADVTVIDAQVARHGANPRNPDAAVNKLPAKYADQSAPVLKAAINEQKNDLEPFRLK